MSFFGFGGGFGFGFGGPIGWCPLGFGEPFIPWYGVSSTYFTQINITNTHITNINNVYNSNFQNGRFVARNGDLDMNARRRVVDAAVVQVILALVDAVRQIAQRLAHLDLGEIVQARLRRNEHRLHPPSD